MSQELASFIGRAWDTATWPAACAGPACVQLSEFRRKFHDVVFTGFTT